MISSLSLDPVDDSRRAAASRANSVRFDESANNHYAPSRQSIDLPNRTGSGSGGHPLSERSLSHRSDGRGSTSGFGRANSFGIESSRLLASIHNSPRVSGNPPPGFFVLGPYPSIIRCWLTETFSNDSLLYAAICTGSAISTVGLSLIQTLELDHSIVQEAGLRKIKLSVYLTEAKIHLPSSRSGSPAPQVPTITAKFVVNEEPTQDKTIQIILGSDILRSHSADILFSQDKLMVFDEDRNQLSVPLVRPENDEVYKNLSTSSRGRLASAHQDVPAETQSQQAAPGIIGRPSRLSMDHTETSPTIRSPSVMASAAASDVADGQRLDRSTESAPRASAELNSQRVSDDAKSATGSEVSSTTPVSKSNPGVWSSSWRSGSGASKPTPTTDSTLNSSYSRASTARPMKVLRPTGKTMASASRTSSSVSPFANGSDNTSPRPNEVDRRPSQADPKPSALSKANPVGSASAFGWLNAGQQRRTTTNGS